VPYLSKASTMLAKDDDFIILFLLLSQQLPLTAALLSNAKLRHFISFIELRKRDRRIPRCALVPTSESSFQRLYQSKNDQSFITFTGLDYNSFEYLLDKFRPLYYQYSPYSFNGKIVGLNNGGDLGGRPLPPDPAGCLGLVLGYTRTRGSLFLLQMVFGASHSVLCIFLKFSMRLLFKVLREEDSAKVCIPSAEDIAQYQEVVRSNFPALDGSWCIMDGLKIHIQKPGDESMQNAYYNGWLHDHFVGCVFAFAPSGVVVACTLNAPGSWHDSFIAENGGLYASLEEVYNNTGGKAVVDSAFSKKRCPFLIKSGKRKPGETRLERTVRRQATSLRQSAEWGMRVVQGSFPRLKDRLLFSENIADRKVFLHLIPMLLNFRTRNVGLNQLTSTFYPNFEEVGDNVLDIFN
jgi:hypothetical protein